MGQPSKTPFYMSLALIGTCLGFLQGIIWACLSFIAIVWHFSATEDLLIAYDDPYDKNLGSYMYYSFIKEHVHRSDVFVNPDSTFLGGMFVYFFISIAWIATSTLLYLCIGTERKFQRKQQLTIFYSWISVAVITIILDLVAFSLLYHDYNYCIEAYNGITEDRVLDRLSYLYTIVCYGIMMTLIARGFVLWFFNISVTGAVIIICREFYLNKITGHINTDLFSTLQSLKID